MHPSYNEFLAFIKDLKTDARITPNALNLAFDVWIETKTKQFFDDRPPYKTDLLNENMILKAKADAFLKSSKAWEESNEILKADLDRLHRERDSFQEQARALAEEVERLNGLFCDVYDAVGERGDACMSIDGGNL